MTTMERGGAAVSAKVFVYGQNGSGGRNVGVALDDGTRLLIESHDSETDERALQHANAIAAGFAKIAELESLLSEVRAQRDKARGLAADLERSLEYAFTGRRQLFGRVVCRPHTAGDWSGAVWLLDPEKLWSGFGLHFPSLAKLRVEHPELWICGVTADGDVLLDASPLLSAAADSGVPQ